MTKGFVMKTKKVLVILGSPRRNGTSALLAKQAALGAKSAGAVCELVFLNGLNIKPCNACDTCLNKPGNKCVLDDDMQNLYPKLKKADAIIMAGPVYWFTISAQIKLFMDRWYALIQKKGHALKGKKIGIILTYGDVDPYASGAVNAIRTYQDAFRFIGAPIEGIVYGTGNNPREVEKNRPLMKKALELGKGLAKGK